MARALLARQWHVCIFSSASRWRPVYEMARNESVCASAEKPAGVIERSSGDGGDINIISSSACESIQYQTARGGIAILLVRRLSVCRGGAMAPALYSGTICNANVISAWWLDEVAGTRMAASICSTCMCGDAGPARWCSSVAACVSSIVAALLAMGRRAAG